MAKRKKLYKSKSTSRILPLIFLTGLFLILIAGLLKLNQMGSLSFVGNIPVSASLKNKSFPQRILITDSKIDLTVSEARIINKSWEISGTGASHLYTSAYPGEKGNIIIYGHNTLERFGKLTDVKKGSSISVYTKDGKVHVYKVENIIVVNPNQTKPLLPTNYEVLTIYTCTGFADLKRLVIQAVPFTRET